MWRWLSASLFAALAPAIQAETVASLTLSTQADVDAASNVTEVTNDLLIETDPSPGDPIVNLDGLGNLQTVGGILSISFNDSLVDTLGLLKLTDVSGMLIQANTALTNLDGLSNLVVVDGELLITQNTALERYCGLYMLFEAQGTDWNYIVDTGSALYGPEFDGGIRSLIGDPCVLEEEEPEEEEPIDPEEWIQGLVEQGVLKKWYARSLLYSLRRNCPRIFLWKVNILVRWRILTEELAQPLIDVVSTETNGKWHCYYFNHKPKRKTYNRRGYRR